MKLVNLVMRFLSYGVGGGEGTGIERVVGSEATDDIDKRLKRYCFHFVYRMKN